MNKSSIHPGHSFDAIHRPRCPYSDRRSFPRGHCRRGSRHSRDEATQVNSNGSVETKPEGSPIRIPVRSVSFAQPDASPAVASDVRSSSTPVSPVVPHVDLPRSVSFAQPEISSAVPEPVVEPVVVAPVVESVVEPVKVETIQVQPAESKPAEVERSPFEEKLVQLGEMGFNDKDLNIRLLVQYKGDMLQTVRHLLDN